MNIWIYLLLILLILTATLVISSRNPVISLLYLVLTFLNASILLLMYNCEFLAMLFLVVYIGAIVVLFLFIVMMLNIKIVELNSKIIRYLPIGFFILLIFFGEVGYVLYFSLITGDVSNNVQSDLISLEFNNFYTLFVNYQNITVIAQLLFSKYAFFFLVAGLILLVAMIGAIVLTLNQSSQPIEWPYRKINMQLTQVLKLTNKKNIN